MFSRSPVQSTLSLRSRAALPTTEAHEIQNESRLSPQYCYVINYAPETGQPCYRLQIRNVQGYNEQVVASTRFTMRTTRNADWSWKIGENSPEYGKWYTIFQLIVYSDVKQWK
jgi:hypothetical protein